MSTEMSRIGHKLFRGFALFHEPLDKKNREILIINFSIRVKQVGSQGGMGKPPPPTEKIVVENGVISEGSILSNKFSK